MQGSVGQVSTAELIKSGVLEIGDGYRAKNSELGPTGIPFARAQNLNNGFDFTGADLYPLAALPRVGTKTSRPGDCVFTSKGSVGRIGYVSHDTPSFVYSPQLSYWRSLDTGVIDPQYLRYWLQGSEFGRQRDAVKGSTDMADYVNLRDQRRMLITLPPIGSQRKIAAILSAYDDLLENNNRRIKLLEEMAQRIYSEWFVDFRYPGHGDVPLVDSELGRIPEGWQVLTIEKMGRLVTGSTPPSSAPKWWGNEYAFITPTDLSYGRRWVAPERRLSALGAQKLASRLLPTGAVCFTCIASIGKMCITQEPSITNQQINSVIPVTDRVNAEFLFQKLSYDAEMIRGTASGAATPIISKSSFGAIRLVWPPVALQNLFGRYARDCHALVSSLERQNQVLRSSRDLLLPRLISSEVDVTDLDIAVPEAAA
jgi:type I restriction enzyme S subunit